MSSIDGMTTNEPAAPTVSIIMPAYGVAPYIGGALESVLNQTYKDYEVIVVNDGSPDTVELELALDPYRDCIVYIKQENRGLSGARNTAVRAARGRYISLLDPDDLWEPRYLEVQVGIMESDPTIDVLYPDALLFGDPITSGKRYMEMCTSEGEVTFERLVTDRCQVTIFVTARRETIVRAGMFDESLRSCEDFDLWLRIVKAGGRIAYHRQVLAKHRRRDDSLSADRVSMYQHTLRVMEKAARTLDLTSAERDTLEREQTRNRAMLRLYEGKRDFSNGAIRSAIKHLSEANNYLRSPKLALVVLLLRLAPGLLVRAHNLRSRLFLMRALNADAAK
jgi:glycosyltransferase involved in cell wall biosynthesis